MIFSPWQDAAIGSLAVWRVTRLLHIEEGPFDLALRLRRWAGDRFWGRALGCFYCLSLWVALPVAGLISWRLIEFVLLWPALSGAACLLEHVTTRERFPGFVYEEPKE
jgi:hypothetical protein